MGKLIASIAAGSTAALVIAYEAWSRLTSEGKFCARIVREELDAELSRRERTLG